jgi:hypothetical protein
MLGRGRRFAWPSHSGKGFAVAGLWNERER